MNTLNINKPQIYVACLSAYNNGYLHGKWIDATQDTDDIQAEIDDMLSQSPIHKIYPGEAVEEWAIHDYEYMPRLSEYTDIDTVSRIGKLIAEHGELAELVIDHYGINYIDEAVIALEDNYQGCYDSLEDYAYQYYNDCYTIPDYLENYIDYEKIGTDMEYSGDIFTITDSNYDVHVFLNN